jgi:hypothetical protein
MKATFYRSTRTELTPDASQNAVVAPPTLSIRDEGDSKKFWQKGDTYLSVLNIE